MTGDTVSSLPSATNQPYNLQSDPNLYNSVIQHYKTDVQVPWAWTPNQANFDQYSGQISSQVTNFQSQFENLVGRAPTADETKQYINQFVIPNTNNIATKPANFDVNNQTQQFIGQNFQKAAQDYATQQLQQQQAGWQSLADTALSKGTDAINATQQSLLDYQSQLFDKLRPNLLTSLKAQGLLDTGGMNEAIAGVQGDLANNASQYIAGLQLQNAQNANNIALTGQAAPLQYEQQTTTGQPSYLQGVGSNATNFNNSTFMSNLDYQHQLGLIQAQASANASLQPSFMRTFGQSAAQGAGSALSQWASPSAYASGSGGTSGASGVKSLFL